MKLNFSNGTSSPNIDIQISEWYSGAPGTPNLALSGMNGVRITTGEVGYAPLGFNTPNSSLGMFETDVDLVARGLDGRELTSITFTNSSSPLASVVGIFAVSGEPVDGAGAPFVVSDPTSQRILENGTANFEGLATGQPPLSYQWLKDSQPLSDGGRFSGTGASRLTIINATAGDAGVYSLVITNAAGMATSAGAVLNLLTATPVHIDVSGQVIGGALSLRLNGPPGLAGILQRTIDLSTWQAWKTITLGDRPLSIQDLVQETKQQQFYRFVSP